MMPKGKMQPENGPVKAAICMRDTLHREDVKAAFTGAFAAYGDKECTLTFLNNKEAGKLLGRTYDIVLFELSAEGTESLETVRIFREKNKEAALLLLAEDLQFVKEAFRLKAYRYLEKGKIREELQEALTELVQEKAAFRTIEIKNGDVCKRILLRDVYYIESLGDEAAIYSRDSHAAVRQTLKALEQQIGNDFYRCHKSYIVNLRFVEKITPDTVILSTGKAVPVAVRRRTGIKAACLKYMKKEQSKNVYP